VKDVMSIYPLADKFIAFGFDVIEIDGNNIIEVIDALNTFNSNHTEKKTKKPMCIIAKTIMGNGISFMHDDYK